MEREPTFDDVPALVVKAVEKGREARRGFPSARSETGEEYTEFQICFDADMKMNEAAAFITAYILTHFSASKTVYWRIYPEVTPISVFWISDKSREKKEFIKFYARLLITDKEETHRAVFAPFRDLEPIEPPTE